MKLFVILAISFAVLGSSFASEDKSKMREKIVTMYECIACASKDAHTEYEKCDAFKPDNSKAHLEECNKKVMDEVLEQPEHWKYLCEHPDTIGKLYDCLEERDHWQSMSEEDKSYFKLFRECAKGVHDQYCKEKE